MEKVENGLRRGTRKPRDLQQLLHRGLAYGLVRAESGIKCAHRLGSHPADRAQLAGEGGGIAQGAMVGDGETVGLVADALQQLQSKRTVGQFDLFARQQHDGLFALGKAYDCYVAIPRLAHGAVGVLHLNDTAVYHQKA